MGAEHLETSQRQPWEDFHNIQKWIDRENARITRRRRFRHIVRVLAKHGILHELQDRSRRDDVRLHMIGERVRQAFEELGPVFIKLGQVIATRQELLPEAITESLKQLLDQVPPLPFEVMATVLDKELPGGLSSFEFIDTTPLASASIAQVYRARWHDGREAAVKVLRPTTAKLFQTDIVIIRRLVRWVQRLLPPAMAASVDLVGLINDYYSSALKELDMREETRAMNEHRVIAQEFKTMHIPEVYYYSERVLVMEFIDGWNLKEFPVTFLTFEERLERMTDLAHYYIKTFLEGYYHADPHGSNIMIDRHTKKAVLIDWGMVGRMDSLHTEAIFRMLLHDRINQAEDAAESALDIIHPTEFTDTVALKDDLRSMLIQYVTSNQGSRYNWGNMVVSLIAIGIKNHCRIPNGLALWAKGFSAAEGTARWLCPEVSYHSVVESAAVPIMRSWTQRRLNYRADAAFLTESLKLAMTFPRRANLILEHLAWNNVQIGFELRMHKTTERLLNKSINRMSLLFLAGFVFIGSAIMALSPEAVFRQIAMTGVLVSVIIGAYGLWRVLWSRRA